jgi:mRNA-degrading endonuclease toxin of MazEF toxin-antitoxin module
MQKDFDIWNGNKKIIHLKNENKLYHERQVWWCSLGLNIGSEQDGAGVDFNRPVLILKGLSRETCLVIPLTTSSKKHHTRVQLGVVDGKFASALLSQVRVVDTKRFVYKIGFIDQAIFNNVRKIAKAFYFDDSSFFFPSEEGEPEGTCNQIIYP